MKQTAKIRNHPYNPRQPLELLCFRDNTLVMTLKFTSRKNAEDIGNYWENGCTMAKIAKVMLDKGLKI